MSDLADDSKELERWYSELKATVSGGSNRPPSPNAPEVLPADNDPMEHRVANLESFAADAKERLARVETKLDHIEKEVGQVKWWIVAQIVAGIVAVLGTGVAIQQMTVTTFEAAAKANSSGSAQLLVVPAQVVAPQPAPAPNPTPGSK